MYHSKGHIVRQNMHPILYLPKVSFTRFLLEHKLNNGLDEIAAYDRADNKVQIDKKWTDVAAYSPTLPCVVHDKCWCNDQRFNYIADSLSESINVLGNTLVTLKASTEKRK